MILVNLRLWRMDWPWLDCRSRLDYHGVFMSVMVVMVVASRECDSEKGAECDDVEFLHVSLLLFDLSFDYIY